MRAAGRLEIRDCHVAALRGNPAADPWKSTEKCAEKFGSFWGSRVPDRPMPGVGTSRAKSAKVATADDFSSIWGFSRPAASNEQIIERRGGVTTRRRSTALA